MLAGLAAGVNASMVVEMPWQFLSDGLAGRRIFPIPRATEKPGGEELAPLDLRHLDIRLPVQAATIRQTLDGDCI
ncbi:MAG: hypothetical protein ABSG32_09890 [Terriglobia bacterium]